MAEYAVARLDDVLNWGRKVFKQKLFYFCHILILIFIE